MEKLEGTVDGMVGDILTLRDHVVALRNQMAALSVPPQSAVTHDMQGFPIASHSVENNPMIYPVQPSVCNVSNEFNKDVYTCGEGEGSSTKDTLHLAA